MADAELPEPPEALVERLALPSWLDHPVESGPEAAWRAGQVWSFIGRYDRAWDWWDQAADATYAPRIRAARAQSLRDLGLHERAEAEDRAGLAIATRSEDRARLLIGFVADAIGRGSSEARARFRQASREVAVLGSGVDAELERIRFGWVAAEVQLLTGEGSAAGLLPEVDAAGDVLVPERYDVASDYHLAKGLLFAGVLLRDLRTLDVAASLAPPGLQWAAQLARESLGAPGALGLAREAWARIVPPRRHAPEVARTPTARRLAG